MVDYIRTSVQIYGRGRMMKGGGQLGSLNAILFSTQYSIRCISNVGNCVRVLRCAAIDTIEYESYLLNCARIWGRKVDVSWARQSCRKRALYGWIHYYSDGYIILCYLTKYFRLQYTIVTGIVPTYVRKEYSDKPQLWKRGCMWERHWRYACPESNCSDSYLMASKWANHIRAQVSI